MQAQMQVPTLSKVNKYLIGIYVGVFIFSKILSQTAGVNLIEIFAMSFDGITSGLIFQLLTYPFVEAGFTSVLFNALLIWFIGSDLEPKWGTRFYVKFLLVSNIGAGLFYILAFGATGLASAPLYGMTGTNLALILAYGLIYSERTMVFMFLFPMPAKYFCMLLAGIELYMGLFSGQSQAAWSHLVAMLCAFIYLKYKSLAARGVSLSALKKEYRRNKQKTKLSIVRDADDYPEAPNSKDPKFWQ